MGRVNDRHLIVLPALALSMAQEILLDERVTD
jgi:hypothetical protein